MKHPVCMLTHVKVLPGEEVSLQHQSLVCDLQKVMRRKTKHILSSTESVEA